MFKTLIVHSWQMMRRSAFFEKSMFAKGFIAFVVFFLVMHLYGLGRALPYILQEHLPDRAPAEWAYGLLPLIFLADLIMRLFIQKMPARHVMPYLHLPVSRSSLSGYRIFRSWIHPMNLYLLFFFWPFIRITINPATSSQELGLLGIFLIAGINQSILMLLRTPGTFSRFTGILMSILWLIPSVAFFWEPDIIMEHSLNIFLGFVHGKPGVLLTPLVIIAGLHFIIFRQTLKNFYRIVEADERTETVEGSNPLERILASVPVFGQYWLLEWRLLSRNRRTKSILYSSLPMALAFAIFTGIWIQSSSQYGSALIYIIIAGGLGSSHLQHAFSWESHFFDFIASRNYSLTDFIRAKFYFYLILAMLQFLVVSIVLVFLNFELLLLFASMTIYTVGLGFYLLFRAGIRHSARMDLQGKSSFNMEGVSGMKILMVMLQMFILLPLFIFGYLIWGIAGALFLIALPGIIFLAYHKSWTRNLAKRLEGRKYANLALYREK